MVQRNILKRSLVLLVWMVVILTSNLVWAAEEKDYYKILGIPRSSSQQQIKKAYKKLSIKWHPDKNKDNQEYAKTMFVDVSNAFDTLSDPEKREVYNRGGVKAVEEFEQRKGQEHLRRDMFGRVIHTPEEGEVREDIFQGTDVFQINLDTIHSFYRRNQVWVILFYKSNQQESKNVKDQYV